MYFFLFKNKEGHAHGVDLKINKRDVNIKNIL